MDKTDRSSRAIPETKGGSGRTSDRSLFGPLISSSTGQWSNSVPRQVGLAIERHIAATSPNPTPQPRLQRRHQCLGSVEAARPLRGIVLFNGRCDLTDAETQEATIHSCRSENPGIIIILHPANSLDEPLRILYGSIHMATGARRTIHFDLDGLRGDAFRGTVLGARYLAPE